MSMYTILDANGEVYTILDVDTEEALAANTPPGMASVPGTPPTMTAYWDGLAWVPRPAQPSPVHSWDAQTKTWVDARTLAEAKAAKVQELAGAWKVDMSAGVPIGGKVAPTNLEAWVDYLTLRLMAQEAGWVDTPIQLVDGSFELITQAKAATLWEAIKVQRVTQTAKLRDKVALVAAATTIEEADAVSW